MTPGPTIIRKCSSCTKRFSQQTLKSGNTIGARFWTDGKVDAPMLPDLPWLVKCPNCGALLWLDEQKKVGQIWPESEKRKRVPAPYFTTPSADDYLALLQDETLSRERKRYLRRRAWWAGNDGRREAQDKQPLSEKETRNLAALAALLSETDADDRLTKAEVFRELGQFQEAKRLLSVCFDVEFSLDVLNIKELVERECPFVAEIKPP